MALDLLLAYGATRPKYKAEGSPGPKTPLVLRTQFHADLSAFLVSTSTGDLRLRPNTKEGVPSNFFPLSLESESLYMGVIARRIYDYALAEDWGNATDISKATPEIVQANLDWFATAGLSFVRVFASIDGIQCLLESGEALPLLEAPHINASSPESDLEEVADQQHGMVATLQGRPVYYVPGMQEFILYASPPETVGVLTRVGEFVSMVLHNPTQGLIVSRVQKPL